MYPRFTTIIAATDFSAASEQAVSYAASLALEFGATLHLLHVVPDPILAAAWSEAYAYDLDKLGERLRRDAERQLAERAARIEGIVVTREAIIGKPASAIIEVAVVGSPPKRRAQVGQLDGEPGVGLTLAGAVPQGEDVGFAPGEVAGMRGTHLSGLAMGGELLLGELADRFQHRESGPPG